MEHDTLAVSS